MRLGVQISNAARGANLGCRFHAEASWANAGDSSLFHQTADTLLADPQPLSSQLGMDPWPPVRSSALGVHALYIGRNRSVYKCSRARRPTAPLIVSGGRNAEKLAHPAYAVLRSLLLDERVFHRDSFAKNAAAFFNISRSSRKAAFSRRRRRFSSSSDVGGFTAAFAEPVEPYFRRHVCSSEGWIPNSRAMCDKPCSPAATRRTASCLNSSLNDRRSFPMAPRRLVLRQRYVCVRETGSSSEYDVDLG